MPDVKAPPTKAPAKKGGFVGFLESPGPMGLPWVGWGVVVIGAIVVGFFWYRNQKSNAQGSTPSSTTNSSQDANALGLAIDPTTGLPYAVEGLVPSGGTVDSGSVYAQEINLLQQELTALQAKTTPPPSTTTTSSGTKTTAVGGNQTIETIAEHWYGVADNSSQLGAIVTAIINANPNLKGDSGTSVPPSGTNINLPVVKISGTSYTPKSPGGVAPTSTKPPITSGSDKDNDRKKSG